MSNTKDREMISERIVDAPIEKVWEAWTNPEILKLWWGPRGFTNIFQEFDFKVGGNWRFIMRGPNPNGNGTTDFPNHSVFLEISKPNKLVIDHVSGPHFTMTVLFEDLKGKTKITWSGIFATVDEYEAVKGFAIEGNKQNLDRLEEVLATGKTK